jgi:hypothetical protein
LSPEERAVARLAAKNENGSGIDAALEELEGMTFLPPAPTTEGGDSGGTPAIPNWVVDREARRGEEDAGARWLRERGYARSAIEAAGGGEKEEVLSRLFLPAGTARSAPTEEAAELREEEIEVLSAIFPDVSFPPLPAFDFALPLPGYEPSPRFQIPDGSPDAVLSMDVLATETGYPLGLPVLALSGGGLPEAALRSLTGRLVEWLGEEMEGRGGDLSNVIYEAATLAAEWAQEWVAEFEAAEEKREGEAKIKFEAEREEREKKEREERKKRLGTSGQGPRYKSEAERRADAQRRLGGAFDGGGGGGKPQGREWDTSGPTQEELLADLFG